MKLRLKFIKAETDGIEVIVKAKERDQDVEKVIGLLGGETEDVIVGTTLTDEYEIDVNDVIIISKDGRYLSVKTTNCLLKKPSSSFLTRRP